MGEITACERVMKQQQQQRTSASHASSVSTNPFDASSSLMTLSLSRTDTLASDRPTDRLTDGQTVGFSPSVSLSVVCVCGRHSNHKRTQRLIPLNRKTKQKQAVAKARYRGARRREEEEERTGLCMVHTHTPVTIMDTVWYSITRCGFRARS